MKKYKDIPIAAAKRIAEQYDKNQVIIVTWDNKYGLMHVTQLMNANKQLKVVIL